MGMGISHDACMQNALPPEFILGEFVCEGNNAMIIIGESEFLGCFCAIELGSAARGSFLLWGLIPLWQVHLFFF